MADTLIEDLRGNLNSLVAGKSWHGINSAQPIVYPYIVFLRVSMVPNVNLAGLSGLTNTRVQVDIYSRSIGEATAIADSVDANMTSWQWATVPLGGQDIYEEAVRAWRIIKEYSVWHAT